MCRWRELSHLVGHRDGLKTALTAQENLGFAQDLLGDPGLDPLAKRWSGSACPMSRRLPVGYLSAGQRRRVALARLLVSRRPFWLLDEPMSALDVAAAGHAERADAGASATRAARSWRRRMGRSAWRMRAN